MARYLVTGAAGFIGSALSRRLIKEGNEVVTIDNLSTGFRENIPEAVTFIEGDCGELDVYGKIENFSFDAIFHIAGQSSGEISFDDPVYDIKNQCTVHFIVTEISSSKWLQAINICKYNVSIWNKDRRSSS